MIGMCNENSNATRTANSAAINSLRFTLKPFSIRSINALSVSPLIKRK